MSHLHLIATRPNRGSSVGGRRSASNGIVRSRAVESDPRWRMVVATLTQLRLAKRRSIRIVDADCGAGEILIHAVRFARTLGFTAIEGRGIDGAPSLVACARLRAAALRDPAIGLSFEVSDVRSALAEEAEFPADIVLWHGRPDSGGAMATAVAAAGRIVIGDER